METQDELHTLSIRRFIKSTTSIPRSYPWSFITLLFTSYYHIFLLPFFEKNQDYFTQEPIGSDLRQKYICYIVQGPGYHLQHD